MERQKLFQADTSFRSSHNNAGMKPVVIINATGCFVKNPMTLHRKARIPSIRSEQREDQPIVPLTRESWKRFTGDRIAVRGQRFAFVLQVRYNESMGKTTGAASVILAVVLLVYLGIGVLYAVYTPAWQVPDEPAHYNYVRHLAETGRFPVLQMGDYPHEYLEEIKARRFPPDLPIDPIRYESHQPPLYYLLAVPVYWLSGGQPLALRLLSVALGAVLLLVAYRLVRTIFPAQPALALGTAAFVAFVPMHVAMTAGVENDTLAELLLAVVALLAVQHVAEGAEAQGSRGAGGQGSKGAGEQRSKGDLVLMGIVLGLVLVTKTTAYAAVPVALVAAVWRWHLTHHAPRTTHHVLRFTFHVSRITPYRSLGRQLLALLLPALLIALPWYARNVAVYGWPDLLGLRWHDTVVVGQPRTAEWIVNYGWGDFLRRFADFSFKSFWGVFGWMGVFVDNRIYLALGLLTGLVAVGSVVLVVRRWVRGAREQRSKGAEEQGSRGAEEQRSEGAPPHPSPSAPLHKRRSLVLLAVWLGWTVLQYLVYNVTFVQHQGRYLFPALIPLGLGFSLGWREVLRPPVSRALAALLALLALLLAVVGLVTGDWPTWPLLLSALAAGGLFIRPWLPRQLDGLLFALPFLGLVILDLISLFVFIVPALSAW